MANAEIDGGGRVTVLIVEDYPVTRFGVRCAIEREPGMEVVGEAEDPADGLGRAESLRPDVAVVDLVFPRGTGLDLIKDLKIRCPSVKAVVYTRAEGPGYAEHCLRAGAAGYVSKSESVANLVRAIRVVRDQGVYLNEDRAGQILARLTAGDRNVGKDPVARLSDGELTVFQLMAQGMSNKDIATVLHRSVKTVETYRSRIKRKLGASNATELAQMAQREVGGAFPALPRYGEVSPSPAPGGLPALLPAAGAGPSARPAPGSPPAGAPQAALGRTVLVVDDHAVTREPLAKLLAYRGFRALTAVDGIEALDALGRERVDAVVLDLMMPGMNGFDFIRRVRGDVRWQHLPVFVLTGAADAAMLDRVMEQATLVLRKAMFDLEDLFSRVAAAIAAVPGRVACPVAGALVAPPPAGCSQSTRPPA